MQKPKITVLGAGSLFFGREAILGMIKTAGLSKGTLALVDTDPERLDLMLKLAKMAAEHAGVPLKIEGSTDRRKVLSGSDFVILSFSNRGAYYRGLDCKISKKHGIRLSSGDTIGPAGIFKAMRELPEALRAAEDAAELCPKAWLINYINPVAVIGLALKRHARNRNFSLCDGLGTADKMKNLMCLCGIADVPGQITGAMIGKFRVMIEGVNHFNWLLKAEYEGRDILPALRKTVEKLAEKEMETAAPEKDPPQGGSKGEFLFTYALCLWDIFGAYPCQISHTREYVPYFQREFRHNGRIIPPLNIFNAAGRMKIHEKMWKEVRGYVSGKKNISDFFLHAKIDYAIEVISAILNDKKTEYLVNTGNDGVVPDLPKNAFLELSCDVAADGPRPRPCLPFPAGVRAMQAKVIDAHELTVEAIVRRDRNLLMRAMLTDPLVHSIETAKGLIEDLFAAERDAVPSDWR